ncbi:hypothetical protein BaRGS_00030109 [Batillaria attramentaria]|uniref:Uncharacterized protein n=1 Tax=Batillaria attramentaria TaxID=370345 RepID=A0ABD0JV98_9CAEN
MCTHRLRFILKFEHHVSDLFHSQCPSPHEQHNKRFDFFSKLYGRPRHQSYTESLPQPFPLIDCQHEHVASIPGSTNEDGPDTALTMAGMMSPENAKYSELAGFSELSHAETDLCGSNIVMSSRERTNPSAGLNQ